MRTESTVEAMLFLGRKTFKEFYIRNLHRERGIKIWHHAIGEEMVSRNFLTVMCEIRIVHPVNMVQHLGHQLECLQIWSTIH
jgi:hypothetical protein